MRNLSIFISVVFVALAFSCRKYEDGPDISFRSKNTRLNGVWDVELFYINGNDSTGAVKNQACYSPVSFRGAENEGHLFPNNAAADTACAFDGTYGLLEDNKVFAMHFAKVGSNL